MLFSPARGLGGASVKGIGGTQSGPVASGAVADAFARRREAGLALVECAEAVSRAAAAMAARFAEGGKLIAFGNGAGSTDAQHIAVEFIHPVIVGKRALPAIALSSDVASLSGIVERAGWELVFARQIQQLGRARDIVVGFLTPNGVCRNVLRGLLVARELGLLTVAIGTEDDAPTFAVDHALTVRSADPQIVKEIGVTIYHILWELVHVFLERPDGQGTTR
jgi:D-sedoheptulose 7-phosphate isomerase